MLKKGLDEAAFGELGDPRERRGRRWEFETLLSSVVMGLMAGCRSMAELEALTAEMGVGMRRELGLGRRVPDTTVRDLLCRLDPLKMRPALHRVIVGAHRRKALEPVGLPFGVGALDGKVTAVEVSDEQYSQHQSDGEYGLVRTITASLVSAAGRPCIDVFPVHPSTNEMGQFQSVLDALMNAYGHLKLLRVISYDAGACSLYNADCVRKHGLDYLFGLKDSQPTLRSEAEKLLAHRTEAAAKSEDVVGSRAVIRRVFLTEELAGFLDWEHLRTVVRIESETLSQDGTRVAYENRYYISSLPMNELSAAQWLLLVRSHWGVENNCHHTFDTVFREDEHPWIERCPKATVVVMVLRRIAYSILTLFRSVTQRSEERRHMPWRELVRCVYNTLISLTEQMLGRPMTASFVTP
jgi:hypothetical protein